MQPGRERRWITAAVLLGIFLAAIEATAVATAMPTAVSQLGSVERYSWAFSAYLLTSTTTVPLFGKLADLHGRRGVYLVATAIFLIGSVLCGVAASMEQLILFRALQGIGAGGVMPVAITVIGDIYSLEERGRMQGLFSGVWAFASITGPAVGGLLTDALSWRWVFLLNVPFGIASAAILAIMLRESPMPRRPLDVGGTVALTAGAGLLLLAVQEGSAAWGWHAWPTGAAMLAAAVMLAFFFRQERRAREPMLPIDLFRQPVIGVASLGAIVIGTLLFPLTAFVPMFAQGVRGTNAAEAGALLMPMMIGWPIAATLSGLWLTRLGYRTLSLVGSVLALGGSILLGFVRADTHVLLMPAAIGVLGLGLGFLSTPLIVSVQTAVPRQRRGAATSSQQFFRTIGGAIAVGILGAVLNANLAGHGIGAIAQRALQPATRATLTPDEVARASLGLANGLHQIFLVLTAVAVAGVAVSLHFPKGSPEAHAYQPGEA